MEKTGPLLIWMAFMQDVSSLPECRWVRLNPDDIDDSAVSLQFNGEGRSYSRFSLTQDADGETNQVELKTSRDGDEEAGETLGGNFSQQTYAPQRWRSPKHVAMLIAGVLFFFVVGE